MSRVPWLLAIVLLCALPSRARADSHTPSGSGQSSSSCGMHLHDDDATAYRHLQCMAGVAVKVSWNGMKVRPAHGTPLSVRFTDATLFETDSGEGVLDGLVVGDNVCVSYKLHSGTGIALLVLFSPDSNPCGSRKHLLYWDGYSLAATDIPNPWGSDLGRKRNPDHRGAHLPLSPLAV